MQRIINREITKTIDMKSLRRVIPSYCRVVKYDSLKNAKNLAEAMKRDTVLIVLFQIHDKKHRVLNEPGHFFVISTRGPEKCVVFSSTGMTPTKELMITQSDPKIFERILPQGTVYNNTKLQINKDSNTCWRWCVVYAMLAPMGLKKFTSLFARPSVSLTNSDQLITALTLLDLF